MLVSNLPTLLAITVFARESRGMPSVLSWLQHRRIFALALWGSAFIIAAVATVLIVVARDTIPASGRLWLETQFSPPLTGSSGAGRATSKASGFQSFSFW